MVVIPGHGRRLPAGTYEQRLTTPEDRSVSMVSAKDRSRRSAIGGRPRRVWAKMPIPAIRPLHRDRRKRVELRPSPGCIWVAGLEIVT